MSSCNSKCSQAGRCLGAPNSEKENSNLMDLDNIEENDELL